MVRPPAITFLAVLFFIGAAVLFVGSMTLRGPAVFLVLFAPVYVIAGLGLWKLLEWGRILGLALAGVEGVFAVFGLLGSMMRDNVGGMIFNFGSIGWDGLIIWCLLRPEIRGAFGQYVAPQAATNSTRQWGQPTTGQRPTAVQQPTAPGDNAPTGMVTVISTPEGADVSVDGDFVGDTPATLKLGRGKHNISVSMAGYRNWSRELSVLGGSEVRLRATLER